MQSRFDTEQLFGMLGIDGAVVDRISYLVELVLGIGQAEAFINVHRAFSFEAYRERVTRFPYKARIHDIPVARLDI